ncbi:hypothetical protein SAMD00023520_01915 [Listeria monocytogenes]|nr:hypothetical protein SAMD00023518_02065 [Listeria monocytogenes]GAT41939.1 hypothetical protein SAMD00023520_01915 [Listeria monocytogenes]
MIVNIARTPINTKVTATTAIKVFFKKCPKSTCSSI